MSGMNHYSLLMTWGLSFIACLIALLTWKHRRGAAERRIAKGLRSYTGEV